MEGELRAGRVGGRGGNRGGRSCSGGRCRCRGGRSHGGGGFGSGGFIGSNSSIGFSCACGCGCLRGFGCGRRWNRGRGGFFRGRSGSPRSRRCCSRSGSKSGSRSGRRHGANVVDVASSILVGKLSTAFFDGIVIEEGVVFPRGSCDVLAVGAADSGLMIGMKLEIFAHTLAHDDIIVSSVASIVWLYAAAIGTHIHYGTGAIVVSEEGTTFIGSIEIKVFHVLPGGSVNLLAVGASDSGLVIGMKFLLLARDVPLAPTVRLGTHVNDLAIARSILSKHLATLLGRLEKHPLLRPRGIHFQIVRTGIRRGNERRVILPRNALSAIGDGAIVTIGHDDVDHGNQRPPVLDHAAAIIARGELAVVLGIPRHVTPIGTLKHVLRTGLRPIVLNLLVLLGASPAVVEIAHEIRSPFGAISRYLVLEALRAGIGYGAGISTEHAVVAPVEKSRGGVGGADGRGGVAGAHGPAAGGGAVEGGRRPAELAGGAAFVGGGVAEGGVVGGADEVDVDVVVVVVAVGVVLGGRGEGIAHDEHGFVAGGLAAGGGRGGSGGGGSRSGARGSGGGGRFLLLGLDGRIPKVGPKSQISISLPLRFWIRMGPSEVSRRKTCRRQQR